MYKQLIKDYFSFTKKERIAVIVLITLIVAVFLLPHLITQKRSAIEITALKNVRSELDRPHKHSDSLNNLYQLDNKNTPSYDETEAPGKIYVQGELFYFDPNTLSFAGWKRMGLPDKTIKTIQHYLSKGGRFRRKEDLGKIYGLHKEKVAQLLPYVRMNNGSAFNASGKPYTQTANLHPYPVYKKIPFSNKPIDLNTTDTSALIALPGIGSKLATRIVLFRERLGGFHEVDQLKEVYGLPDSTFQDIKSRMFVLLDGLRKININTADVTMLKLHPYIRWNLANAIVQYRMQHGHFKSVDDIRLIPIITPDLQKKLLPYLTVD